MAAPPFPLGLLALLLLAAAAPQHLHLQHHGRDPHHHQAPSMMRDTARFETALEAEAEADETQQSLRVRSPDAAAQAPSGEESMAATGAVADTTRRDLPSPPPSIAPGAAADPTRRDLPSPPPSIAPEAEESGSSESEPAAPPAVVDAVASTPPPPPPPVVGAPYRDATSPPPHVHDAAGVVSSGTGDELAKLLAFLGYNDMASSATLLPDTESISAWPGAITVFAAPDVFLEHYCTACSRRHFLLDHMALGYFPFADLAAAPPTKLPSAYLGFCLDVDAQRQGGPFSVGDASLYVNGAMVSEQLLYDDGRYIVHGLHGFIPPLSHASCAEDDGRILHHQIQDRRRHHLSARSVTTSAATAGSVSMIRQAISRLRDSGFGFVALAMRVNLAELQKLSNLTVFALDDQVIFTGGGHSYISAVRYHIVPGHRLTRADLLLLRPGTVLPTLAGEDKKLIVTLGAAAGSATDEVQINYIMVKEPEVVINSRVAAHGIAVPFPASTSPTSRRAAHP